MVAECNEVFSDGQSCMYGVTIQHYGNFILIISVDVLALIMLFRAML